jgi:predicted metal-dependent phosphoesterase TrpH
MKIDLHVHTRERSSCAHSSADEMIRAAIYSGLDGLVITDHDRLVPQERLAYFNAKYAPFRVYGGIEVTTHEEHVLVIGVREERLEQTWWAYADLHAFVVERGGFLAVAHPFRFSRGRMEIDLDRFPPHALEVHSRNTPPSAEPRIREMAERLGLSLLSNSDAHHISDLGGYYNVLDGEPEDMQTLMRMLKEGAFEVVAPRPAS